MIDAPAHAEAAPGPLPPPDDAPLPDDPIEARLTDVADRMVVAVASAVADLADSLTTRDAVRVLQVIETLTTSGADMINACLHGESRQRRPRRAWADDMGAGVLASNPGAMPASMETMAGQAIQQALAILQQHKLGSATADLIDAYRAASDAGLPHVAAALQAKIEQATGVPPEEAQEPAAAPNIPTKEYTC